MDILYLGYFCKEELFNFLVENGSKGSHARQELENKLLRGLLQNITKNDTLEAISYLPNILKKKEKGEIWNTIPIKYLWCNKKNPISVVQCIFHNLFNIISWCKRKKIKIILIYSANPLHAIPALFLRKCLRYKVVTLCPEISIYRRNGKKQVASIISRKIEHWLDNSFDGYIVLTEQMNEIVNIKNHPFLVMEGISDIHNIKKKEDIQKEKAILYAGGLYIDNGIEILLQAFIQLNNEDWELWICGDGELKEKIQKLGNIHKNIIYYGLIPNSEVLELESKASLLINPRLTTNEFTKYSFPSKIMEYMASGTATIVTELDGIPKEYFQYLYVWKEQTTLGMRKFLEKLMLIDETVLCEKGMRAQKFVLENKNVTCQGARVIKFLASIVKKG